MRIWVIYGQAWAYLHEFTERPLNISAFLLVAVARVRNRGVQALQALAILLSVTGCASVPNQPQDTSQVNSQETGQIAGQTTPKAPLAQSSPKSLDEVAVDDLVRALVQYRDPIATTLQAGLEMASEDNAGILGVLAEQGYGLQLVDADQGAHLLNHEIDNIQASGTPIRRHTLQVLSLIHI